MSKQQPRPGQTTLAGSVIIAGSIIVVLTAWQRVASLHTLEVREEFARMLTGSPLGDIGWSVDDIATAVRVLCLVGAGAATAATVLGFQVFKRSRSARIALTALAPLLILGGFAMNGFFAPMVAAAITMLWLQPTRDWYAGRPWMQRYEQRYAAALRGRGQPEQPPSLQDSPQDPSQADAGAPAAPAPAGVVPPPPPSAHPALGRTTPAALRRRRPPPLVSVCAMTWALSGLVIVVLGVLAAMLPSQSDELMDQVRREYPEMVESSRLTETDLLIGFSIMIGVLMFWAVVAIVLAALAFAGHNWARIMLAVSAFAAAVPVLFVSVGAWPLVALVAALAGSGWLLLRPEVAAWYRH